MELNIKASFAFLLLFLARLSDAQTPAAQPAVFDITKYGASSNGDISKALLDAFKEACASTSPSTIVIPKGTFEMAQVKLQGPCKAPLELQVQATLKANADPKQLSADIEWLTVNYIDRFTLSGGGIFDGQGKAAWSQNNCKDSKSCGNLPNLPSQVKISKVSIKNVRGTSRTQDAVLLLCSKGVPCEGVEIGDIDIAYNGKEGPAKSRCENVKPTFVGKQNPPVCAGAQSA
ncbi:hypothetical protein RND71_038268 [Anisodus tanguticus]|uniref:Polygalacturonase n=1 Tax=Anisodus tanguticus TaxID=243964 RepID=A0AAE1R2C1_9SOLA|nr:hypothetical protein RND71_038268 [Anisodus tanguticus]